VVRRGAHGELSRGPTAARQRPDSGPTAADGGAAGGCAGRQMGSRTTWLLFQLVVTLAYTGGCIYINIKSPFWDDLDKIGNIATLAAIGILWSAKLVVEYANQSSGNAVLQRV
jgi:hypothetical protein